jgi:hypothetical protein
VQPPTTPKKRRRRVEIEKIVSSGLIVLFMYLLQ